MTTGNTENALVPKQGSSTVVTLPARIPPIHVHIDSATTVLVHIKKPKQNKEEKAMSTEVCKPKGPWIPPPGKCIKPLPAFKDSKSTDSEFDPEVNEIILDHLQKCKQEVSNDSCTSLKLLTKSPEKSPYLKAKLVSGQERAFLSRSLSVLRREQCDLGQIRSTAGKDPSLSRVDKDAEKAEENLSDTQGEMRELQDSNSGSPVVTHEAVQKRESLIRKLNEFECTHKNLKDALGVPGHAQSVGENIMERLEYAECKNREYECRIREQDLIIDRSRRQIQCEKDYVSSLSRMQAEMEETRASLQRELLCKAQEVERTTIQMKTLQGQMCGHITEVERLQEYVDQTTKKSESEKESLKKTLKCQQERLSRTEEALQKAVIRIECMELENSKLRGDMKHTENEIEVLRPDAEAKKQLEEVCQKLQAHLRELQPLPELLKTTELKLQEEQSKNGQCEQRVSEQARLIHELTAKIDGQISTLKCMKDKVDQIAGENAQLQCKIDNLNQQVFQGQATIGELNSALHMKNELINQMNLKLEDKDVHTLNINKQLEEALAESNRLSCLVEERSQLLDTQNKARVKEMQEQLAAAKQDIKQLKNEKQEMECKYGRQMNDLREKLEQCDMATHSMQSYIAYLKTSYASVFNDPNLAAVCNPPVLTNRESGIC